MPELPEVETTRRGIAPHLLGREVEQLVVRNHALRWPVPSGLSRTLPGQVIKAVDRRAKYLLIVCERGTLLVHLGMSGSLRMLERNAVVGKHDHVDLIIRNDGVMRLTDPRRFGAFLWTQGDVNAHPLLAQLGPEPLSDAFDGARLHAALRGRSVAIKQAIMDSKVVVGVGNIYASEALFGAGINPRTPAGQVSRPRCARLAQVIQQTLQAAIDSGGSTLRNFLHSDGGSGHYQDRTWVYDRAGDACKMCGALIRMLRQGQRSTFYCPHCQR
jgi:formamidopyrimidine-DNA glycosylase